jgi:hypothetical protein
MHGRVDAPRDAPARPVCKARTEAARIGPRLNPSAHQTFCAAHLYRLRTL